jgi:hypothetical protein
MGQLDAKKLNVNPTVDRNGPTVDNPDIHLAIAKFHILQAERAYRRFKPRVIPWINRDDLRPFVCAYGGETSHVPFAITEDGALVCEEHCR